MWIKFGSDLAVEGQPHAVDFSVFCKKLQHVEAAIVQLDVRHSFSRGTEPTQEHGLSRRIVFEGVCGCRCWRLPCDVMIVHGRDRPRDGHDVEQPVGANGIDAKQADREGLV
ncbi:MAG: hypothetical protein ACK5C3_12285 [bacterium]